MAKKLALLGGSKTIHSEFPKYHSHGEEEARAAKAVIDSRVLSHFYGSWCDDFFGGPRIQEFEKSWSNYFGVRSSIAVNSATSGLIAAVGALDINPYDEVIVSPWTMCASATAIMVWNAIPVFADIEKDTFNIDPKSIEKKITSRTKAIMVPDIFGHGADMDAIMAIAKKHNLKVIEDASQSPAARYKNKLVGTIADIGVFSLNYHKHIHTGEGGVCVTNDTRLAERMQLIRNHAEAVVGPKGSKDITNMMGFNFRLGEIEAAMGNEQLKKLDRLAGQKTRAGTRLSEGLRSLKGLVTPAVKPDCTHVYYVYGLTIDKNIIDIPRSKIVEALTAEGVPTVSEGYLNIHLLPMYQQKILYGSGGYPWKNSGYTGSVSYEKGICPVAEELQDSTMFGMEPCVHNFTDTEVDLTIEAFHKVWANLDELQG